MRTPPPPPRCAQALGVFAAVLVLASGSLAAQSDTTETEHPEVEQLSITGVHHVDRAQLAASIYTQANQCKSIVVAPFCLFSDSKLFVQKHYLDRTEFKRDVLRIKVFYWRRGYRSAQVDTSITKKADGVKVSFAISEGPPTVLKTIKVTQTEPVLSPKDIRRNVLLRSGKPLDLAALDSSRTLLRNRLWDKGYSDAILRDTTIVAEDERSGVVLMTIDPRWQAKVESITVSGNKRISDRTIHNMITLRQGAIFRRSDVIASQRNLYESNLFRSATISVAGEGDSLKQVAIAVTEAPFHEVNVSGGFNTVDFGQAQGRYSDYDWMGGARRLDLAATLSNLLAPALNGAAIFQNVTGNLNSAESAPYLSPNYEASATVTQPWFHDPRNTIGASLFGHRRTAPAIFVDKGYGASMSFTRSLAPRTPLSIVYRYEQTEVDAGDLYFCVDYGVCELPTIGALRGRHALSPISVDLFTDRTDNTLSPTTGYTARLDVEHASAFTLSSFRYNRISGEVTRYVPIGKAVLAGRISFGWVRSLSSSANALGQIGAVGSLSGILHPRKRFYAGGSNSVRGYEEDQLGPRVLTIDPTVLEQYGCTAATIADATCNPAPVPSNDFQPRPTGGTSLLEGNIEYRFPIWKQLGGAVFVDGAFVGVGGISQIVQGAGAITPGVGVRYASPVGPIRIDLGVRPGLVESLRVVTEAINPDGTRRIVELATPKDFNPIEGPGGGVRRVLRHLALHLSIGQAF